MGESTKMFVTLTFLNEVLSLNAQEYGHAAAARRRAGFLNEVLSLNAQEFQVRELHRLLRPSSMKS